MIIGLTDLTGLTWTSETGWGSWPAALEDRAEACFIIRGTHMEQGLAALGPAWGELIAAFGVMQPPLDKMLEQIRVR